MENHKYQDLIRQVFLFVAASLSIALILVLSNRVTKVVRADQDGHSHFRFGHITWKHEVGDSPNTARITFIAGFRRSGFTCANPLTGTSVPCSEADGRIES
jgi:hypothetical protein